MFLDVILYYGLGPAAGLLVGLLLSHRLRSRTHRNRAFLVGLLILAVLFGLQQLALRTRYLAECGDIEPGSVSCEWAFVPFMVSWSLWGVGGLIYFLTSVAAYSRPPLERPGVAIWRRKQVQKLSAGVVVIGLLALGANEVVRGLQRAELSKVFQEFGQPIAGVPTHELGKFRLPKGGFQLETAYADELEFSPDGRWLAIHHSNGLDIRQLPDLKIVLSVEVPFESWDRWVQFSPDANLLAIIDLGLTERQPTEVYRLTQRGVSLAWTARQMAYYVSQAAFSPDGQQILILDSDAQLIQLDAQTGEWLRTIQLPSESLGPPGTEGTFWRGLFSPSAAYVALAAPANCKVELFSTASGDRVGAWDLADGPCPGSENPDWGHAAFRPDDRLVWVLEYEVEADRVLWAPNQGGQRSIEHALVNSQWYAPYAVSPDWQLMVVPSGDHLDVWSLADETTIGSFFFLPEGIVTALAFTPDGRLLVVGTEDGYLRFFANAVSG